MGFGGCSWVRSVRRLFVEAGGGSGGVGGVWGLYGGVRESGSFEKFGRVAAFVLVVCFGVVLAG